jgi:hypothetical protein
MIGNSLVAIGPLEESHLMQIFFYALAGGGSAFIFVWVGAKVAPRGQFLISIILAVLYSLVVGFIFMGRLRLGEPSTESWTYVPMTELIVSSIAGLIGAVAACYSFYEADSRRKQDFGSW